MGGALLSFSLMAVAVRELLRAFGTFEILFLRLPLIGAVGVALYGEPLEPSILIGAAVIFSGTYYSIWRESR
jgi:drug/metabolite transporter (DMT)-like permease